MSTIESENFPERLRSAISLAWNVFMRKVGNGLISINKEASMQLHYAYTLQQIIPLLTFHNDEIIQIELETGVKLKEGTKEIDLLLKGKSKNGIHNIAIEMKCYKTLASSGKERGATDIFMKDIYEDLKLLESYIENKYADQGVSLVMNELERLVNPKKKTAKCWTYDISNNTNIKDIYLNTPIGGKDINIYLKNEYTFLWEKHGLYWFMELEGR